MSNINKLSHIFRLYSHPRLLTILFLGFVSGLPLALTGTLLYAWLQESGIDIATIGLFAAIGTPYSLKFLWAPFMDALPFPVLSSLFGRRRGWILATQIALIGAIAGLAFSAPAQTPWVTALWALLVAFCSASQDIVIDAYRVEILEKEQYGMGAAMVQYGYRLGMLASGAGALALADHASWTITYLCMAAMVGVGMVTVLLSPEPETSAAIHPFSGLDKNAPKWKQCCLWLEQIIVIPFKDFMTHSHWLLILLFVLLYKMGDAFLGSMTTPFLLQIGFTKSEIAAVVKLFGFGATMLGLFLGGLITYRWGTIRALWVCGIGHALTNLMFVVQARVGADATVLAIGITLENISGGMTAVAFVAFLSGLCSTRFTATQYALLSSLAAVGRTWLSTPAGWVSKTLGWEGFFLFAVALAVPGLVLLWWLSKRSPELTASLTTSPPAAAT